MGQVIRQKDRVFVSYDRKINLGNYESVGISAGYTTDVKSGESVDEAFTRCDDKATEQFERLCKPFEGVQTKGKRG